MKPWIRTALEIFALAVVISLVIIALVAAFVRPSGPWIVWGLAHSMVYGLTIGGIAAPVMNYAAPKYWRYGRVVRWSLVVVTLIVVAFVGCAIAVGIMRTLGFPGSGGPYWTRLLSSFQGAAVITLVVGIIGTITESYRERLERTTHELRERELDRERLRKLANEAQLATIESRIQPHFLFNTLNSISSLIREDPEKAERLIERLSALLRSALDTHQTPLVPLRQEMKLVEDYLAIQQARFGDRLRYAIAVPVSLSDWGVPPFSVQTLVENSVKYAVATRRDGGLIEVRGSDDSGRAAIEVIDDGPGFDAGRLPAGHGLDNLHSRLTALFDGVAGIDVRRGDNGMSVGFTFPRRAAGMAQNQ